MRCPITPRRLFARIRVDATILPGNVIEVACMDCRTEYRRSGLVAKRVLHRFNLLGVCVETVIE